jgi:hypothetical protein
MKTYLPAQEKALLLFLTLTYWIVFLAICWFSFDSIQQFVLHILSQSDLSILPGYDQSLSGK